jgi:hypothetical protein
MMKTQLIARLKKARTALTSALESIHPETGITPEWTIKEIMAHIAGWDDVSAEAIRKLTAGEQLKVTVPQGIHAFNEEMAATWAGKKYEHAFQDFSNSRKEFIDAIEAMPEHLVGSQFLLPWGDMGTLEQVVEILSNHETEHTEDIHNKVGA